MDNIRDTLRGLILSYNWRNFGNTPRPCTYVVVFPSEKEIIVGETKANKLNMRLDPINFNLLRDAWFEKKTLKLVARCASTPTNDPSQPSSIVTDEIKILKIDDQFNNLINQVDRNIEYR